MSREGVTEENYSYHWGGGYEIYGTGEREKEYKNDVNNSCGKRE